MTRGGDEVTEWLAAALVAWLSGAPASEVRRAALRALSALEEGDVDGG
jgi:hypothetical protein